MILKAFNSFLLQKFASNLRIGSDARSMMRRNQTLLIIYGNIFIIVLTLLFEIGSLLMGATLRILCVIMALFFIMSFISLKYGKNDLAAIFTLLSCHAGNAYGTVFCHSGSASAATIFLYPYFSLFMSSSIKVQTLNVMLSILQALGIIFHIRRTFEFTMSEEQTLEVNQLISVVIACAVFLSPLTIIQKILENNLWRATLLDHTKAEEVAKEVMQAVEAKETFISSLSHEIRNPLNSMSGSISYLLEVVRDPQQREILNNAKLSGEILLNLINNLLDTAKLKSEKMELSYSETDLTSIFKKVLTIMSENLTKKRIFVDVFVDSLIPQTIWSDASRLLQIMMNLMSNSIKFTPEGKKITIIASWCCSKQRPEKLLLTPVSTASFSELSIEALASYDKEKENHFDFDEFSRDELRLRTKNLSMNRYGNKAYNYSKSYQRSGSQNSTTWKIHKVEMNDNPLINAQKGQEANKGFIKIQISDTGCGIEQENIPKLFQMFTQAHRSVASSHGGTGLGLWICKQLCQKLGGDINLTSQVGKGTNFVFYIPVDNNLLPGFAMETQSEVQHATDKAVSLVVDDYQYNRDLHKLLLEREGVQVVVAADGEEAVKKYTDNHSMLDFIMMDIQMPKMDGFTAARKIRELEAANRWKTVDIYFVSGEYYNEEEVMASFNRGTDVRKIDVSGISCLKKPVDIGTFKKISEKYSKKKK